MNIRSILPLTLFLACAPHPPAAKVPPTPAPAMLVALAQPPAPRPALERALPFIEREGNAWMERRKCVSCHNVGFALWSHREAQRAGVAIPGARIRDLEARARASLVRDEHKALSWTEVALGRDPADAGWPAYRTKMVDLQNDQGLWEASGQFPSQRRPLPESDAAATAWTLLALTPSPATLDRPLRALRSGPPGVSNEWVVTRLLVEQRLGPPDAAAPFVRRLIADQHPDGGWSFLAGEPSNALSTGQSLYALRVAGLAPSHPALRRAVAFLVATQTAEGYWSVPSGLFSEKPEPSRDGVYRFWGTAWAAIGLARAAASDPVVSTAAR
jgi:squalene-hopene/tetraprenyl-beta-curcumene cyclase